MKRLAIALGIIALVVVLYKLKYPTYSYRYRMTVNVEVDGQLRSGSSVIEVSVSKQPVFLPGVNPLEYAERGEAAFVDLGNGRNIVALLASGPFAEGHAYPAFLVPKHFKMNLFDDHQLASLSELRGKWELEPDNLPTLVTFASSTDPATVKLISVDQIEQTFGPGVRWRGVTIEMTTDAITAAIEARLPWVAKFTAGLSGSSVALSPGKFTLNGPYLKRT
ncbi:hypothetical protein [Bradyrhizobium valentinum]|uniref:Uncharacterized protein n=1 Tax=Bradyrhizobium valentinum TaxID=1518501 RepID=A0A0R3LA93_9BRAD|nr:hypothetical protein [Bradyrhizobium valentinum]KRR02605.1 hypothetical protein CP49_16990 [Bradyrhizobium valentinum]